jgi:hypothetical protein
MAQRCKVCGSFHLDWAMLGGLCARCRVKVFGEAGPLCACGKPLGNGVFQCLACEMTAVKTLRAENDRQEMAVQFLNERNELLAKNGNRYRSHRRRRIRKLNKLLEGLGVPLQ